MKSKIFNSTLWMLAVAFLATFSLSTKTQADVIYTGTTTNTSVVNNAFNLDAGGTTLSAGSPGLILNTDTGPTTNFNGHNNASGIASTDNISTLLDAFTPGRTIQATDVVTLNFDVASYAGELRGNGIEVGLAPGASFRPDLHLLYSLDADNSASGMVDYQSSAFGGSGGANDQTGYAEDSLNDGYNVNLVVDQAGYTFTISGIVGAVGTTQTYSSTFAGTEFIDNIGLQHLYIAHQGSNDDPVATFNNVTIDVTSVAVPEPGSLAVLGLGALGLIARRRRR